MYVSSYCYICVLILLYMCPHTAMYVSSYCYVCVLILLYICVLMPLCWTLTFLSRCLTALSICVLIPLYMCPHISLRDAYLSQPLFGDRDIPPSPPPAPSRSESMTKSDDLLSEYADGCWRMLAYADSTLKIQVYDKDTLSDDLLGQCEVNPLTYAHVSSRVRTAGRGGCEVNLDLWRMLTYADRWIWTRATCVRMLRAMCCSARVSTTAPLLARYRSLYICVLMSLCMCPHVSMYVSSCLYVCVLMSLCMCPHVSLYVSSCLYACVLMSLSCSLCMCPHTSIPLYMCPHTSIYVSSYLYVCALIPLFMCPHVSIYVSSCLYVCVLVPLWMCLDTSMDVSWYLYVCFLIPLYMCPHTSIISVPQLLLSFSRPHALTLYIHI